MASIANGSTSIKWKLLAVFGVLISAVVLFQVLYFPAREAKNSTNALALKGRSVSSLIAHDIGAAYEFGDADSVREVFSGARSDPDLEYVVLLDANGKRFAELGQVDAKGVAPMKPGTPLQQTLHSDKLLLQMPIETKTGTTGTLVVAFNTRRINAERVESRRTVIPIGVGVLIAGLFVTFLIADYVGKRLLRLTHLAEKFASGDLCIETENVEPAAQLPRGILGGAAPRLHVKESRDEVGRLSTAFNFMAGNLKTTITNMMRSEASLSAVFESVGSRSAAVITRADEQRVVVEDACYSLEKLNGAIGEISQNVSSLEMLSEDTASAIREMVSSLDETAQQTDSMMASVEETASAASQMVTSVKEIDGNVDFLRSFVADTSSSMVQMSASIAQVDASSDNSFDLATRVAAAAESGRGAVDQTIQGMEKIRSSVERTHAAVSALGTCSDEIGEILTVIDSVAHQTNLLALNAAILAAQAGEHGKGFTVVANEIRDLAERTGSSTQEIAKLIRRVQNEVKNTLTTTQEAIGAVESGVSLSRDAGRELGTIQDLATRSAEMGKQIAGATREQAKGSSEVQQAVDRLAHMIDQLSGATSRQSAESSHIIHAVDSMRDLTRRVRHATIEQKTGASRIAVVSERLMDMVGAISTASTSHAEASSKMVGTMARVRDIAETNRSSADEMNHSIGMLTDAIRGLDTEVRKFKLT